MKRLVIICEGQTEKEFIHSSVKEANSCIPSYNKVLDGNCIAMDIGLPTIRRECPLFHEWLTRLEQL